MLGKAHNRNTFSRKTILKVQTIRLYQINYTEGMIHSKSYGIIYETERDPEKSREIVIVQRI